jgi:hypothetical protein
MTTHADQSIAEVTELIRPRIKIRLSSGTTGNRCRRSRAASAKMENGNLARFFWHKSWPAWDLARPTSRSNAKNLTACSNGDLAPESGLLWPKSWPGRHLALDEHMAHTAGAETPKR